MIVRLRFAFLIVLTCSCVLVSEVYATNGMRLIGIGPTQRSMGGATVGLPLDTATTITNPAGIIHLGRRMDYGVSFFKPKVEHTATGTAPGVITNDGQSVKSDSKGFVIPAFGLAIPVNDRIAFGLGAFGISGEGVDYPINLYGKPTFVDYAFMKFAPAFAVSIFDGFTLGIAPNVGIARMDYQAGGSGSVAHNGATAFGIGYTIGMLYEMNEYFNVGLAYESRQWFEDFDFNTSGGTDSLDFDQPATATLGFGIKPYETLRFAVDVQWIDWSSIIGKSQPAYSQNDNGSTPFDMRWDDQIVFKFGFEYDAHPRIRLRGGYNYGKQPLNDSRAFESLAFPAITEHHVTAGLGLHVTDDLQMNLGVMYAPEISFDVANASEQFIESGNTKMSQYSVDFGLSYLFD